MSETIRITKNVRTEDGFLFWTGDTFNVVGGAEPFDQGVEVKTAGEYVWIPPGNFEVVAR